MLQKYYDVDTWIICLPL